MRPEKTNSRMNISAESLGNRSVKSEMNRSSISFQMVRNTYTKIPC